MGTRFIQWVVQGTMMDQFKLDRFYISNNNQWFHAIHKLEHVQNQTPLDHDFIVLKIQLTPSLQGSTRTLKMTQAS